MNTEFIEKYDKLSDMKPGQVAISKDREKFFVCGWGCPQGSAKPVHIILDMNNLHNQYPDKRDMSQEIKILVQGDKFVTVR